MMRLIGLEIEGVQEGAPSSSEEPARAASAPLGRSCDDLGRVRSIVQEHYAFLWRTLRRLGVAEVDVDDAAQEACVVIARNLAKIELGRERAFVFGTAVRIVANYRRRFRRRPEELSATLDERDGGIQDPEQLTQLSDARRLLQHFLNGMNPVHREVFVLCVLEDLDLREAAELLHVPVGTVSSRLRKAREVFDRKVQCRSQASEHRARCKP